MPTFNTTIELHGKTATGLEVPAQVVEGLRATKRPPVRVTINGYTYRTTVAPMGGRFMIPLSAENRAPAGVAAGDRVEVRIELDTEPREVAVPADYAAALDQAAARSAFDALSFTQRKEHVRSIEDAKTDATRQRRIGKFIDALRERA